jgi:dehydratase
VNLACEANPPFDSVQFTLAQSFNSSAPSSAVHGVPFKGTGTPVAWTVPTSVDGITISALQSFNLTIGTTDATINSASISGGSNLGSGTPSIAVSGSTVVLSVPGPLTAGSTITLPKITLNLTGKAAGTVKTFIGGTSYSSPGVTVTAVLPGSPPSNVGASCYPNPTGPVLTSTHIS